MDGLRELDDEDTPVAGFVPDADRAGLDLRFAAARRRAAGARGVPDELLAVVDEIRAADEQDLRTGERTSIEIHRALGRLRRLDTPERLVAAAPIELTRACGFGRAMISRVHHSEWVPILAAPGVDADSDAFRAAFGEDPVLPLAHMLLEAEMVRRRIGIRVENAATNPLCHRAFVTVAGSNGYVGAPIMPSGKVIGFFHADRRGQRDPVTDGDLQNITLFAEHFGLLYERAILHAELGRRAAEIAAIQAGLLRDAQALIEEPLRLQRGAPVVADEPTLGTGALDPPGRDALLTTREREVLELIIAGETNRAIARELVLGNQTVKTHVSNILRKLRASNRAEAAARYLRITGVER